jgi:DNA (cytosine-5-)-methyltransferase
MANLSQERRLRMLSFLETLRKNNQDDVSSLRAINEIEQALNEKKYGLEWEEHSERVDEAARENILVFSEDFERKITADLQKPYNFLLEGDNLHSLKLLKKTYRNRIDIIYIDPPYNRGKKDFRYNDKYVDKDDLYKHSKWLSFMSKRLEIARSLLNREGVIFISIDDNENAPLKMLCDEIFGDKNFIAQLIVASNSSKNNSNYVSVSHEYILCYARDIAVLPSGWRVPKQQIKVYEQKANQLIANGLTSEEIHKELLRLVKYPRFYDFDHFTYADENGVYQTDNPGGVKNGNKETILYHPITKKPCASPAGGWRYKEETLLQLLKDNQIAFGEDETIVPRIKRYLHDYKEQVPKSIMFFDSQSTTKWLKSKKISFEFPKALDLIKQVLSFTQNKSAIILDFFAGSGTVGHAVVKLNKEDGGTRRYILCTDNENNIASDVTYKRLKVIQNEFPHNIKYLRTDLIKKADNESLLYELLPHIKSLVELDYACNLDDSSIRIFLTEDEFDMFMEDNEDITLKRVFLASDIFMSSEQEQKLAEANCEIIRIPEYYYRDELIETGDI